MEADTAHWLDSGFYGVDTDLRHGSVAQNANPGWNPSFSTGLG